MSLPTAQDNRMTDDTQPLRTDAAMPTTASAANPPPGSLASEEVLRGQQAVVITHNGARYRLQTTRQGKLILTK